MRVKLSKELCDHLLSDNPILWLREARAFLESASVLEHASIPLEEIPLLNGKRPVSTSETSRFRYKSKITGYLYSVSIELFLKSIYSASKNKDTSESNPTPETLSFGHEIGRILKALIEKQILDEALLSHEAIPYAELMLEWFGRYHMPKQRRIEKMRQDYLEKASAMFATKTSIEDMLPKLKELAEYLSGSLPKDSGSIYDLMTPFF